MESNNPLKQYFRQPTIFVKLPSNGKFYPTGTIDIPPTGEFPVYPMTAIDEITYRTPDALFNGQAVVNVMQSCMPDIKDAWQVPAMDVDTILVAIRVASYGHDMDFETTCPACNETNEHTLDLRTVLDKMVAPDYTQPVIQGDLTIFFKPMTYRNMNDNNKAQFEQQKMLETLPMGEDQDQERVTALSKALIQITQLTVKALTQSIAAIKTPQAMVSEPHLIEDFLNNCDRKLFKKIEEHIIGIKTKAEIQPLQMICPDCQHKYEQPLTLDMANFFADAS